MSQEVINATVYEYSCKGWRLLDCDQGLGFLSPCGKWLNYIDVETGERWYLNRRHAESKGFDLGMSEYRTPVMAIAE